MEYNKKICDMAVGDQVEGYYVLKTGQIRTSNSGRPFLAAVVSDRTGSIEAKAWDYAGPISTPDEGQVLKIRGTVTEFRGALQLNMERLRRAEPRDPVDMGSLVATAPIDGERAWAEVEKLVDSIADGDYRAVCRRLLEEKGEALRTIPAAEASAPLMNRRWATPSPSTRIPWTAASSWRGPCSTTSPRRRSSPSPPWGW